MNKLNKSEIAELRAVSTRMCEARELTKLTQTAAADKLGISPEFLKKTEKAFNIESIPALLIKRMAELYDVSADYLLNLTGDEWETDPIVSAQRKFGIAAHREVIKKLAPMAVALNNQERKLGVITESLAGLMKMQGSADESLKRFVELNQQTFLDMRGGASLVHYNNEILRAGGRIKLKLTKAKILEREI